jgi:hypothetical protein
MKIILALAALAALGGCAVQPAYYPQPVNPYAWHTVSVTPVQRVDGNVVATGETTEAQPRVVYSTEPVYATAPVYVAQPLYAPAPAYYYPPVTLGFDFVFGNWGHRGYGRGYGYGGRGYGRHR